MFAGGRTTHHNRLVIGPPARKSSYVVSTTEKTGRSGVLTFVTVRHEIEQMGQLCVTEEQDIVYRAPSPGASLTATAVEPARPADLEFDFDVDPVVLFRFSSVTRNAHRIHYDLPYAAVEGYPDLVVHGPLQIVLMAGVLRQLGLPFDGRPFSYRLQAPAIGAQRLSVRGSRDGWAEVRDASGTVTAVAELAPPE
jgi:3-methylfumaryl-CoA hydratase